MKITAKKHISEKSKSIKASIDYSDDEQYLTLLASQIESILLTEFDVEADVERDGMCIRITTDMYDPEEATEALITEDELVGLTGDLEADAYPFAEEFYASI